MCASDARAQTDNQVYDEGGQALARAMQTNRTLRNFSYGGQGATANRIDTAVRRLIDQAVLQNKRYWELFLKGGPGAVRPEGASPFPPADPVSGAPSESLPLFGSASSTAQQQLLGGSKSATMPLLSILGNPGGQASGPVRAPGELAIGGDVPGRGLTRL